MSGIFFYTGLPPSGRWWRSIYWRPLGSFQTDLHISDHKFRLTGELSVQIYWGLLDRPHANEYPLICIFMKSALIFFSSIANSFKVAAGRRWRSNAHLHTARLGFHGCQPFSSILRRGGGRGRGPVARVFKKKTAFSLSFQKPKEIVNSKTRYKLIRTQ